MATNYPGALDSFTNPTANDTLNSATVPHADQHANANDAIEAIQATLGINPQGGSATVVARLNALDATVASKVASVGSGSTAITIGGTATAPTIAVATASVSTAGVVQLTDSTSSTSTTTAATPASVKSAYDLAAGKAGLATANTFTTGTQVIQAGADGTVALRVQRNSPTATADIAQFAMSTGTKLAWIDKDGKITAPDFIDSSMTTAGVVTNNSAGLLQSNTSLSPSLGGTGSIYGSLVIGHSQLNAVVTKNVNDTTPEAIFRTGTANSSIVYFNVDADTTYFFEGFIQMTKTSTDSTVNTSALYYQTGTTTALTEQAFRLSVQYFTAAAVLGVGNVNATATAATSTTTTGTAVYALYRGFIRTHATTAGRFNISQWVTTAGASAPTWAAGSYINLYKVGTGSAQTFGNWS